MLVHPIIYGFFNASLAVILKIPVDKYKMPVHFPCLHIIKNQGPQMSTVSQLQLVNRHMKSILIGSPEFKIVLSTSIRTWLIYFSRPEFY